MSRIVPFELKKRISYKRLRIDLTKNQQRDRLTEIKTIIAGIHFRDDYDENIFFELMLNIEKYNPLVFYTDDNEFIQKGKEAYKLLVKESSYQKEWFSIKKLP